MMKFIPSVKSKWGNGSFHFSVDWLGGEIPAERLHILASYQREILVWKKFVILKKFHFLTLGEGKKWEFSLFRKLA